MRKTQRLIPRKQINYKIYFQAKLKKIWKKMPLIVLLSIIVLILWYIFNLDFAKTKITIINQNPQINNQEIINSVQPLVASGVSLEVIKNKILSNPWVKNVDVKILPDAITIKITQQQSKFVWHNFANNAKAYINNNGDLFTPKDISSSDKITIISSKKNVKQAFENLQKYQTIFNKNIKQFIKTGIETIILKNGAKIILGNNLQVQRLKNLEKNYHFFNMHKDSIVDLRYRNGFAKIN